MIAIWEIEGGQDGENISEIVPTILKEFEIVSWFYHFSGDNAGNHDTTMNHLNRWILDEEGVGFNIGEHQLHCFTYDMQITINGLLFGPKAMELETYQATADVSDKDKVE